MIEASTQFMVGRLSTESGKCNSFNWTGFSEKTGVCECFKTLANPLFYCKLRPKWFTRKLTNFSNILGMFWTPYGHHTHRLKGHR